MTRPDASLSRPPGMDAPVFAEPWQADAFAMVVALHERGLFSWTEWADALSEEVKMQGDRDYYACWLAALETLLAQRRIATAHDVDVLAAAWVRAAHATPHGQAIVLENDPERG